MKNEEKKYRRSPISVACYVLAAAMLAYVCYLIGTTVQTINEYYAQYGMSATFGEYITYTLQSALQPIVYTVVFFMLGCILDAVRMNNENNYKTDEELAQDAAEKKQAKEARKLAKGEAAAIKAGNVTTEEDSVEADFMRSLNEELKAYEKPANRNGSGENRKPRGNNSNRSDSSKSDSGRNGNGGKKDGGNTGKKAEDSKKEGGSGNGGNGGSKGGNTGKKAEDSKKEGGSGNGGNGGKKDGGNAGKKAEVSKKESGSGNGGNGGSKGGNGGNSGQRRSSNRKSADKPKLEDATKAKADDGFEVVIAESESNE